MDVWCTRACPALSEAGFRGPVPDVLAQVHHVIVMTRAGTSDATCCCYYVHRKQAHRHCGIGLAAAATVVSVVFLFALSIVSRERSSAGFHYAS